MSFLGFTYLMQNSIFEKKDISIKNKRYLHFNREIYILNRGICMLIKYLFLFLNTDIFI